jgi:hypothetical protein
MDTFRLRIGFQKMDLAAAGDAAPAKPGNCR